MHSLNFTAGARVSAPVFIFLLAFEFNSYKLEPSLFLVCRCYIFLCVYHNATSPIPGFLDVKREYSGSPPKIN